ncbi:MAG: hypothetical protein ABIP34_06665 [Rhodoferax sp.]
MHARIGMSNSSVHAAGFQMPVLLGRFGTWEEITATEILANGGLGQM